MDYIELRGVSDNFIKLNKGKDSVEKTKPNLLSQSSKELRFNL